MMALTIWYATFHIVHLAQYNVLLRDRERGGHTLYQVAHAHDRMNRTTAIKHLKRFNSSSFIYTAVRGDNT